MDLFRRALEEYAGYRNFDVTLLVDTDAPMFDVLEGTVEKVIQRIHLPAADWRCPLLWAHRDYFIEHRGDYDLFAYFENDLMVPESVLNVFEEELGVLPAGCVAGFFRYEVLPDGAEMMVDTFGVKDVFCRRIGGRWYFWLSNLHSGGYVLSRSQMEAAAENPAFATGSIRAQDTELQGYGYMETAATGPYYQLGFQKVVPVDKLDRLMVWHQSDKYAKRDLGKGYLTRESLKEMLKVRIVEGS